jgi:signal transduction histidine kinase
VRRLFTSRDRRYEPLDANKLAEETISLARMELEALGIRVQLELARQLPPVLGDRQQLQEVLLNLVSNAAESMRGVRARAAKLRIESCAIDGNRVEVAVADSGTGIDPAVAERMFEPFFTTKAEGTGMGLAICKSIVEGHGGTLSAGPGRPHGAVFRVVLPCA